MGLRKTTESAGLRRVEPREYVRDYDGLLAQLQDDEANVRRHAARDLAEHAQAGSALCEQLLREQDPSVREVIFTSLGCLGGDKVVNGLLPLLRSEDANLRNSAIEMLATQPEAVGPYIDALLRDPDPDVRIFTVNLLGELHHPHVARWLSGVLQTEPHVNVIAAVLEVLAETGTADVVPAIQQASLRFASDAFIAFAADMAIQRIEAS